MEFLIFFLLLMAVVITPLVLIRALYRRYVQRKQAAAASPADAAQVEGLGANAVTKSAYKLRAHGVIALVIIPGLFAVNWVAAIVYLVAYFGWGVASGCPKCHAMFARSGGHSEFVGTVEGSRTVIKKDQIRMKSGNIIEDLGGGKVVGHISRQEQEAVTYKRRRHFYMCKCCEYNWTEIKTSDA